MIILCAIRLIYKSISRIGVSQAQRGFKGTFIVFLDSIGVILKKSHSSHYKMVILDKVQGKIECIAAAPSFSVGTLITYTIRPERTAQFISDSALVYAPLSLAQADILFFHHVIELIYYFTQIGNCAKGVFELLSFLYATEHETITTQFKKIFLLKLLTCMGSVPDLTPSHTDTITYLNTMDLQQINTVTIDTLNEKKLDRWLWCCVWQHPYVNEFKTVHFLAENRAI